MEYYNIIVNGSETLHMVCTPLHMIQELLPRGGKYDIRSMECVT